MGYLKGSSCKFPKKVLDCIFENSHEKIASNPFLLGTLLGAGLRSVAKLEILFLHEVFINVFFN